MLSKIERIGMLLVKLQRAGFVDYTHYHLSCGCNGYDSAKFDAEISLLEVILNDWRKSLENYRKQYPPLNYYTSQQLLDLQKELGQLKKDHNFSVSPKLKQLLLSVTSDPFQSRVVTAIKNAMATLSKANSTPALEEKELSTVSCQFDVSSLSLKQKNVYESLISGYDYEPLVVSKAFVELGEDAVEADLCQWCSDNEHKFKDNEEVIEPMTTEVGLSPAAIKESQWYMYI